MTPQIKSTTIENEDKARLQEQFIRQVDDRSLPAEAVLIDQQEGRAPNEAPVLFVP